MKRFILMAAAAALLAIPAAEAQKVNKEATLSKLEKSDADIANPKKNAKAATWINRGRVYYDAAAEPTANLLVNLMGRPFSSGWSSLPMRPMPTST